MGQGKFHFGAFDLDIPSGELRKQGIRVRLPNQSFQVLTLLLERPGDVVTREELQHKLWPAETFVDFETGLSSAVKKLREALGDSAESPRFVETLPRRGYRFIAPVNGHSDAAAAPAASLVPPRHFRRATVGIAAFFVVAGAVVGLNVGRARDRLMNWFAPPQIRSIAVLPLENLTGDAAQNSVVDALTDSLTTELVRAGLLEVASRTSAMQFKGTRTDLAGIAKRLNVDAVVEGTVSRSGDRWLFNVQLIHGSSDRHVWAQRYEREPGTIADLPGEMAWEMLRAIPPQLQPQAERGQAHRRPANEAAYEAYILGRSVLGSKRNRQNVSKSIGYFQQAIDKDPGYGPAYSGLSDAYRMDTIWGIREGNLQKAEAAARKALELDPDLAEAHTSLGGVLWRYWKWEEAEREFLRALELDPNYAEGYRAYGTFLFMLRRYEESLAALRRAHGLDRLSMTIWVEYATALIKTRHFDEALQELQHARELDPSFHRIYQGQAFAHYERGDRARAITVLEQAPRHRDLPAYPWLGYYYASVGRKAEALEILHKLEANAKENGVSSMGLGIVHLGLGNKQKALDFLEKGIQERPAEITFTGILYDFLKDEPRYQAILHGMGLHFASSTIPPAGEKGKPALAPASRK